MTNKRNLALCEAADRLSRLIEQGNATSALLLSARATAANLKAAKQLDGETTNASASFKAIAAKVSARDRRWLRMRQSRRERQRTEQWARTFAPKP